MSRSYYNDLVACYHLILRHHLGYALFGRVVPAIIFALIMIAKASWLIRFLREGLAGRQGLDEIAYYSIASYHALVLVFLFTVCLLFVIRKPIVGTLSGFGSTLIALAGTFLATPLAFADITVALTTYILFAILLMVVGTSLSLVSLFSLGRCFGISPQARGLVSSGPYRLVRHPLYVGEEITTLGMLLPVIGPLTAVIFLAHLAAQFARALLEEATLEANIPQYRSYKQCVARFIPGLY